MADSHAGPPLVVAVLAAGLASRFGAPKQDQPCAGRPLGAWALDTALSLSAPVVVVVREGVQHFLERRGDAVRVLVNPVPEQGLGGSVAIAAAEAEAMGAGALLVMLADMPMVRSKTLAALVASAAAHGISATAYEGGRRGVPACFAAVHFPALAALAGDVGAREILQSSPAAALVAPQPEELADVDEPADLDRAAQVLAARRAGG